ncbi:MAG: sterol desaturase family protein [bacterium]|nr:sterol desaturase family protein [bacterium]
MFPRLLPGLRKNVTKPIGFILLWAVPVAGFALIFAVLAGDIQSPGADSRIRAFLVSTELLLLIVAFFAFCFCMERVAPYRARWNRAGLAEVHDVALYFLAIVPAETIGRMLVFIVVPWVLLLIPESLQAALWPRDWPLWIQVGLGLLIFDFVYYWYHRLSHTRDWLWAWHRLHHTPEYLVASKGLRHTLPEWGADIVLHSTAFALAGMPPIVIFWLYAITMPIGILSHANIAVPNAAGLAAIFNLPGTHRIHHDRELRGGLKNFSAFTMIWDHVFRTYESPARYRPRKLGVDGYSVPENLWRLWFSFLNISDARRKRRTAAWLKIKRKRVRLKRLRALR